MQECRAKPRAVLTQVQVKEIFKLQKIKGLKGAKTGASFVSRKFRVSEKTVRDIWNGRTWQDVTVPLGLEKKRKVLNKLGCPSGDTAAEPQGWQPCAWAKEIEQPPRCAQFDLSEHQTAMPYSQMIVVGGGSYSGFSGVNKYTC